MWKTSILIWSSGDACACTDGLFVKGTLKNLSVCGISNLGAELANTSYIHPLKDPDTYCCLLDANHVTADKGTGLVHTAPAHGIEDFQIALEHGLTMVHRRWLPIWSYNLLLHFVHMFPFIVCLLLVGLLCWWNWCLHARSWFQIGR